MTRGVPVTELSDAELAEQGTAAHATRNWVFLHGTAEQFENHTERMLELEQEYLRRFPKRTWQGTGEGPRVMDEATRLRQALRGLEGQIAALLAASPQEPPPEAAAEATVLALLQRVADAGGRLHKLELHQVAREVGLSPASLASLYRADPAVLCTEKDERVLTDAGRQALPHV